MRVCSSRKGSAAYTGAAEGVIEQNKRRSLAKSTRTVLEDVTEEPQPQQSATTVATITAAAATIMISYAVLAFCSAVANGVPSAARSSYCCKAGYSDRVQSTSTT